MSLRGYQSYSFQGFGRGLNLRDKVDSVDPAECIDCLNVTFTDRGAIEQRAGAAQFNEAGLTNAAASLEPFYTSSGTRQLLAGCGTRLEALSTAGAIVKSATGLTNAVWDFVRFGKPNAEVAYAGNGTDTLRKWNGAEWTAPTATVNGEAAKAMPKAGALAVWPAGGNRLVATGFDTTTGGPGGATSSPDHVWFSDPGDPEAWHTKTPEENDVQLMPGNGEPIMAVIAWRELIFVFKETVFFVFYGVATNAEGSPEFLFRAVEAGLGLASSRAICVHRSGVYFMSHQGVYRTTGEEPELVSSLIEPIWSGDASPFFKGGVLNRSAIDQCAMATHEDRIFLGYPSGTGSVNNKTLVYDPQFDWWSLWSLPMRSLTSFRFVESQELLFGYVVAGNNIGRFAPSYTSDAGSAISSYWRSGWFDLENPDVKTLRSSKYWGSGEVFAGLGHDFQESTGTLDLLDFSDPAASEWGETTWGGSTWSAPQPLSPASKRRATRGTTFSLYLENSTLNQSWSLHRADYHLREIARPSEVTA